MRNTIGEESDMAFWHRAYVTAATLYMGALLTIATVMTVSSSATAIMQARSHVHVRSDHYGQARGMSIGTDTVYCSLEHEPGIVYGSCQSGN